jgi:hypothetical protein
MPNRRANLRLITRRRVAAVPAGPVTIASINFRGSSGYVTHGAGQTYMLGEGFPTVRAGLTMGWQVGVNATDRDTGVDPRFAGINWLDGGATNDFTLTLPSTGTYNINYAVGDASGGSQGTQITILDNATTRDTSGTMSTSGTEFYDISGTKHATSAAWVANSVAKSLVFATTTFVLRMNHPSGGAAVITHLVITQ